MIRYSCSHCDTEIGSISLDAAEAVLCQIKSLDEGEKDSFLSVNDEGTHIRCICEHCEQSLKAFPDYYTLKKWLQ
ncbi:hypothetical protein CSV79_10590 [Sporosarcina sp. P13]|uniref:anti-sigma-F factor Fin n=1 Tax=Sporosarcina sp. P13 TaxID=2048263 RepID=UPI000C166EBE|nr:anti-sigma-F factor Fin [Sporosarcina sp. P13]PIC63674.1 hypothetical protein CSV79_10590 [Sporosarcina sp. P13]